MQVKISYYLLCLVATSTLSRKFFSGNSIFFKPSTFFSSLSFSYWYINIIFVPNISSHKGFQRKNPSDVRTVIYRHFPKSRAIPDKEQFVVNYLQNWRNLVLGANNNTWMPPNDQIRFEFTGLSTAEFRRAFPKCRTIDVVLDGFYVKKYFFPEERRTVHYIASRINCTGTNCTFIMLCSTNKSFKRWLWQVK